MYYLGMNYLGEVHTWLDEDGKVANKCVGNVKKFLKLINLQIEYSFHFEKIELFRIDSSSLSDCS